MAEIDERRILTQIKLFRDQSATRAEIETACFLEDKIATTAELLGMLRRHELTVDFSPSLDEPIFRRR